MASPAVRGQRLRSRAMTIGISIFLIAVGAILRYAVTVSIEGIELDTVGLILMIAGIIGLVIALAVMFMGNDRRSPDEYPTRRY
jgi:Domain of unknown function (DUF6458)